MWAKNRHGAEMIRRDLKAAEIPYEDESGRQFDFHALRHQYISSLAAAGVHPKAAMMLARHSTIELTMQSYTHLSVLALSADVNKLPGFSSPGQGSAAEAG